MPLFWLSIAFLCGILAADIIRLEVSGWLAAGAVALALACLPFLLRKLLTRPRFQRLATALAYRPAWMSRFKLPVPIFLLLAFACAGAARYQAVQPVFTPASIGWYNDRPVRVVVEGLLIEPPDERDTYTNLRLRVEQIRLASGTEFVHVHGLLLAQVPPGSAWKYGDRLSLAGSLETPPSDETFSYRDYLLRQGVLSLMPRAAVDLLEHQRGNPFLARVYALKDRLLQVVYRIYPDPEASLLAGILIGVDTGLPAEVSQAFKDTGTAHIIAISGFNMSILAGLFLLFFSRLLGRWRGALAALAGIIFYTILVGLSASVVRAAIMSGLSLFAVQLGRRQSGLNSLAISAAAMAAFSPTLLWDVGFQLSFMATLGLVLYAGPLVAFSMQRLSFLNRRLPPAAVRKVGEWLGEFLLFTLAAQVTTLPVIVYHFQRLSLVSFLANPLVLPAQAPLMVLGGLAVLFGLIWLPLGQVAAYLAWPFAAYTIRVVEGLATLPNASWNVGRLSLLLVVLYYAVLFALTFAWPPLKTRFANLTSAVRPAVPLAVLSLVTLLVWQAAFHSADGRLHLFLLDTNTSSQAGEALLIQSPTGRWVLIDGGPSPSRLSEALGRRLPLTARRLDVLVAAGTADDQLGALPDTLDRFLPQMALWAGPTQASRSSRLVQELLVSKGVPQAAVVKGQALDLGGGAVLRALYVNDQGALLLLEWDRFRTLIPLGLEYPDLEALEYGRRLGPVSALLLADGGYAPLNPPEWIANLRPQVALASVTVGSRRVLPSPETLRSLEGFTLLRTDRNGWIEIETDGTQMWVWTER